MLWTYELIPISKMCFSRKESVYFDLIDNTHTFSLSLEVMDIIKPCNNVNI